VASRAAGRVALRAIHPQYANAILDGTKQVEFRKRRLASDVEVVLIYATSPVKRIIGAFSIKHVVAAAPKQLWKQFSDVGGVDEAEFHRYFENSEIGIGLVVKRAYRLPDSLALGCIEPTPAPPQSFCYLHEDSVSMVVGSPRSVLERAAAV
jgi:predicted transcriptional regulator